MRGRRRRSECLPPSGGTITFGATLDPAALFLSLALTANLAVYDWLDAWGSWSSKEANRNERLVYCFFIASIFTVAAGTWYVLAFVGSPVRIARRRPSSAERRYPPPATLNR